MTQLRSPPAATKTQRNQINKTNKLTEEIRFVVTRGRGWGKAKLDEGGQKVQTSSYKINKY